MITLRKAIKHLFNTLYTLKTQLECTFIIAGLPQSANISSIFMPLTTDGQIAILLMSKLSMKLT